jgi:hypothetical protein
MPFEWMCRENTDAYNQYIGPRRAMAYGLSFPEFAEFLCSEKAKEATRTILSYLSLCTEITEDCRFGVVDERAVLHFHAAFTIAYYPDQEFFLTTKDWPDNAALIGKARAMLGFFEQILELLSKGSLTSIGNFALKAREYFRSFREWLPRDRLRVVKLATNRLMERHMQGLPETDPNGSLLRSYLCNAGGQTALRELDLKKVAMSAVAHAFGANLSRGLVSITERDDVLVIRVAVPDPDEADAEPDPDGADAEPMTYTENPELIGPIGAG